MFVSAIDYFLVFYRVGVGCQSRDALLSGGLGVSASLFGFALPPAYFDSSVSWPSSLQCWQNFAPLHELT